MHSITLLNITWDLIFIAFLFCVIFSTEESKVDADLKASPLSNSELSQKSQWKTCVIGCWKVVDIPFAILTEKIYLKPDLPD